MRRRCIRNAAWVVAWDDTSDDHVYRRNIDVVFSEDGIEAIEPGCSIPVDEEIDGTGLLVIPGLIDIHSHPGMQPLYRGFTEEFGNPRLFNSGRQRFRAAFSPDHSAKIASARFALAELAAGGVTTLVDLSHPYPGWLDILDESRLRVCVGPMYRSAEWYTDTGHETKYWWKDDDGAAAFREAMHVMDAAESHKSKRFTAMVAPAQVDTCSENLLKESIDLSASTSRPLFTHASQSYAEFNGMVRRNNKTPIEWLGSLGFLRDRTIIGHGVFTDEHPWLHWPSRNDIQLLASNGVSIAHCPTPFIRDATLLHNLGSYVARGINVAIGTDTHPHNLIEEARWAEMLARAAAGPTHSFNTRKLLTCLTTAAAKALNRDDIGRLAPGSKADLVLVDLDHPTMQPLYDPLRSFFYSAADRAVRDVYVDGTEVVRDSRVVSLDRQTAAKVIGEAQERIVRGIPAQDPEGLPAELIMPRTLDIIAEERDSL